MVDTVDTNDAGRDDAGKFAQGNRFGKGRPPRAIEQDYLSAFSECVPLGAWRGIIKRAVKDAQNGDSKAREFISKYALGSTPKSLTELAIRDELGVTSEAEIKAMVDRERKPQAERFMDDALGKTPLKVVIDGNDYFD